MGLWDFAKRHKKKFIFAGVFTGGAYCAYRYWLPRLQQKLLEKLISSADVEGLLKEFKEMGESSGANAVEDKQARCDHSQKESDAYVQKGLRVLASRHLLAFQVEAASERLKQATDKAGKLEAFRELQIESLSRLVSAVYLVHALLLLNRVEFNILGREIAAATAEDSAAHEEFLNSTDYAQQEETLGRIAQVVRTAVLKCAEKAELAVTTKVTAEFLERFLVDVSDEVDEELLSKSNVVATLLPESVASNNKQVKPLLDEARDYLESPQFLSTFKVVKAGALAHAVACMGDSAEDPEKAPLAAGKAVPLAKLFGDIVKLSGAVFGAADSETGTTENVYLTRFAEELLVKQFSEAVYFQGGN